MANYNFAIYDAFSDRPFGGSQAAIITDSSSIDSLCQHLLYVSDLVGSEHVGFGIDYSPDIDVDIGVILRSRPDYWPAGQQYATKQIAHAVPQQLPQLIAALAASGFAETELRGFLGENFRRVATAAWNP